MYYQSSFEESFLKDLEEQKGSQWFSKNVQNGKRFHYFNPKKNTNAIYESDFMICGEIYEIKSGYWWNRDGNDKLLEQININKLNSAAKEYQVWLVLNGKLINWNLANQ